MVRFEPRSDSSLIPRRKGILLHNASSQIGFILYSGGASGTGGTGGPSPPGGNNGNAGTAGQLGTVVSF